MARVTRETGTRIIQTARIRIRIRIRRVARARVAERAAAVAATTARPKTRRARCSTLMTFSQSVILRA